MVRSPHPRRDPRCLLSLLFLPSFSFEFGRADDLLRRLLPPVPVLALSMLYPQRPNLVRHGHSPEFSVTENVIRSSIDLRPH